MSFGIGIILPKCSENIGVLFRSAQNFGALFIFTIGARYKTQRTDTQQSWRHIPCLHYKDWQDYIEHAPLDWVPVAIEITEDANSLPEFKHPKSAVYFLGPEDGSIPLEIMPNIKNRIFIPTIRCLNVAVSGSIVMYDRISKQKDLLVPKGMTTHKIRNGVTI